MYNFVYAQAYNTYNIAAIVLCRECDFLYVNERALELTQKATTTPDERPDGSLIAALKNPQ